MAQRRKGGQEKGGRTIKLGFFPLNSSAPFSTPLALALVLNDLWDRMSHHPLSIRVGDHTDLHKARVAIGGHRRVPTMGNDGVSLTLVNV
jgi:hypothetical protein